MVKSYFPFDKSSVNLFWSCGLSLLKRTTAAMLEARKITMTIPTIILFLFSLLSFFLMAIARRPVNLKRLWNEKLKLKLLYRQTGALLLSWGLCNKNVMLHFLHKWATRSLSNP